MKPLPFFALTILVTFGAFADAPRTIKTLDGQTYEKATVTKTEKDGITVSFDGGIVKIAAANLPPELRKELGIRTAEEAAKHKEETTKVQAQKDAESAKAKRDLLLAAPTKPTQEEANAFFQMPESVLIAKLGEPVKVTKGNDVDGAYRVFIYDETNENFTNFRIWDNDKLVSTGIFRRLPVINPKADVKKTMEALKKLKKAGY